MAGQKNVSEEQYKKLLLETAKLIRTMGANEGVSSVIPDFVEGERSADDTLQILQGIVRNWNMKENILFQVWTLKQAYNITDEEIAKFWPDWYTAAVKKGDAVGSEDVEPRGVQGDQE